MSYLIIKNGESITRHLEGRRRLSDILSDDEYEQFESGDLIAIGRNGGILSLSSPLEEGQRIELRPPGVQKMIDNLRLVIDELYKFDYLDDEVIAYSEQNYAFSYSQYLDVHYWLERIAMEHDRLSDDDMCSGEDLYRFYKKKTPSFR